MKVFSKIALAVLASIAMLGCSEEQNTASPSSDAIATPQTESSYRIHEMICTTHPAAHPHGRYRIEGPISGASLQWSSNYGTIVAPNTSSIVHISNAPGWFTLTVKVTKNGVTETVRRNFRTCTGPF